MRPPTEIGARATGPPLVLALDRRARAPGHTRRGETFEAEQRRFSGGPAVPPPALPTAAALFGVAAAAWAIAPAERRGEAIAPAERRGEAVTRERREP